MRNDLPISSRLQLRESHLFVALTVVVGVLAGLSAVLFVVTIELLNRAFFGFDPSWLRLFAMPVVVSLAAGVLMRRLFHGVAGSGIPQTKAAYHLHDGVVSPMVPVGKFLLGALTIGGGHSLGREGPSVQIGAGIASVIGQWLRLPPERLRDLMPVGAAGALAAAFNTPVAAVIFALEEIIGDMNATLLGSTVVASVASVVVARSVLGSEPLFHVPAYHLVHPAELFAYAGLGVFCGILSLVFTKGLLTLRAAFRRLPPGSVTWQPAMGGVAMGLILAAAPQTLGVGYDYVDRALNGGLVLQSALMLCVLKLAATVVSYASGNPGGVFAPTLYIGAMAGAVVGLVIARIAPFATADPGAYALVGMGALFAGIIRAPMTSVIMIFELTQDYQIIVPLMVANLISFYLSRQFQHVPLYHALLEQDDVHVPSATAPRTARDLTAADVMTTQFEFLSPETSVSEAASILARSGQEVHLVGIETFAGTVTRTDLQNAAANGLGEETISRLIHGPAVHAHPDHPVGILVERLAHSDGLLPILSREDIKIVLGVVTVEGIMRGLRGRRKTSATAERRVETGSSAPVS